MINIPFPDEVLQHTQLDALQFKGVLSVLLFEKGFISMAQAIQMAETNYQGFGELMQKYDATIPYNKEDLDEDLISLGITPKKYDY
jgi:predicted HTH domain antitoxin